MSAPNGHRTRSPIYVGTGSPASADLAEYYHRGWKDLGLLIIDPEDVHDEIERQFLIGIAERRYGRRGYSGSGRSAE